MKKLKSWLALVLAIALVSTTALYQLGTHLSASESEQETEVTEEQPTGETTEENDEQESATYPDSGQVEVREIKPEQSEETVDAKHDSVQQSEGETTGTQETVAVKIQKSNVDGGTIKVLNEDGSMNEVSYDSDNQYEKIVEAGSEFLFEITTKEGYRVNQVTDQNGTLIQPENVEGNVSAYRISDVQSEENVLVSYEENTEEVQNDGNDVQEQNASDDTSLLSITGPATVEVGNKITLSSNKGSGYYHKWRVSDDNKAGISTNATDTVKGMNATVTGKKTGTVVITHEWGYYEYLGWGSVWRKKGSETYDVTVTGKTTGLTRVYVYVKLDTTPEVSKKWKVNGDGWYTIGYIDVSSDSVPLASEKTWNQYYPEYRQAITQAVGKIQYYAGNKAVAQGIDLAGVDWSANGYGLKIAAGASDYGDEAPGGTNQWHLDGLLKIEQIEKHKVTIRYVYEDGKEAAKSKVYENVETGTTISRESPEVEGYTPDQKNVQVTVLKDDVTVTVTYKKNYPEETITIKAKSAEKVYDGTALTEEGYTYTEGILLEGDELTAETTGSQTEAGTSDNVINGTDYKIMHGSQNVTDRYKVELQSGTLTVKPQSINPEDSEIYNGIQINNPKNKVYDGQEHKWSPKVTDAEGNELQEGTDYTVSYSKEDFINVTGIITVTIEGTGNYTGTVEKSYQITARELTVTTESGDKVYDGEPLTAGGEVKGLVEGESVSFETTGSQTEVGDSQNGYRLTWDQTAKEQNYKVTEETLGTLTVKESEEEIIVTTTGGTYEYDGKAHGATVTVGSLPTGYRVKEAESDASATDVEDGKVNATADRLVILNKNDKDVTKKLKITYKDGTIEITPKAAEVFTPDATKVYDGTALTAEGKISGLVKGEKVSFETTGSQTEAGESKNTYTLEWNQNAKESNYTVAKKVGTLKVKEQSIVPGNQDYNGIQINDPKNKVYDGQEHKWSPKVTDAEGNELQEGRDYTVSYSKEDFTDVTGIITVTIEGTGNYTGAVEKSYRITERALTVTTESGDKVYDGEPLTAGGEVKGLVEGESVSFETTGSQTEVGDSRNGYRLTWDRTAKEQNYRVTEETLGTLTVKETEEEIIVTTTGGTYEYDGTAHGATVTVGGLPTGYRVKEAESDASVTDVEDGKVNATADRLVILNKNDKDVTKKLKITYKDGTIEITPKTAEVFTPDATKVYDGTALTAEGKISGLVKGEKVSFETTGSQTEAGESKNTYTLEWNQNAKESNYTVEESVGTLAVTASTITNPSEENPTDGNSPQDTDSVIDMGEASGAVENGETGTLQRFVDTVKEIAADVREVFNSEDGDVPLANKNLDEHKCCVLHLLILLLTVFVCGGLMHRAKKRQKKTFELREELDTELVKRGLPTSKKQKNK